MQPGRVRRRASVVVIGAGLAGLAAAYELRQLGVDVLLVEARERVGGRVHTVPLGNGEYFEAGGEFVSPGHACFLSYAKRFGIALESSKFYDQQPRITLDGRTLSPQHTQEAMAALDETFATLTRLAGAVNPGAPWTAPQAQAYDDMSLSTWLDSQPLEPRSRALLRLFWEGGNGIGLQDHSFLAVLAQVGADTHEVNALRCSGGSDALPRAFAAAIGADRIFLSKPVAAVDYEDGVCITTRDGSVFEADWGILALPPGPWRDIRFRPHIGDEPQMGCVLKFVQFFATRAPRPRHAFCDAYITATWGGTDRVLVGFAGGPAAQRCLQLHPPGREAFLQERVREMLGHPLPGVQLTHFVDWAAEPYTQGGYSAPAPGQIMRMRGRWQQAHRRLLFAGEHTSPAYFGFMEGALQSGAAAVHRLIELGL